MNKRTLAKCAAVCIGLLTSAVHAQFAAGAAAYRPAALHARYVSLQPQLVDNPFRRPFVILSEESSNDAQGELFAVVPFSFSKVSEALASPVDWCDIFSLHLNTKYCKIQPDKEATALLLNVGKKFDQPLSSSFRLTFAWTLAEQQPDYLRVNLKADYGPFSTHDYRISFEAIPLDDGTSFLHFSYAYGYGVVGKIAMLAYFGTTGRSKVGFTVTGKDATGNPQLIEGMRGLIERNTMRYFLAIETFLGAQGTPKPARFEKRINDWFDAIERYPRQLHEMEKAEYLEMKRKEALRQ